MRTESQNKLWSCLSKDARDERRTRYRVDYGDWSRGFDAAMQYIFGHHNLTSDVEPEEMIVSSKKEVQNIYNRYNNKNWASNEQEEYGAQLVCDVFEELFDDKCLLNKPIEEQAKEIVGTIKDSISNPIQMPETMLMSPDKDKQTELPEGVLCNSVSFAEKRNLENITSDVPLKITASDSLIAMAKDEMDIQKPKFKVGDKVRVIYPKFWQDKIGVIKEIQNDKHFLLYGDEIFEHNWFMEDMLEPYIEETENNNMEGKEINLCEILKGCEGFEIFLPAKGTYKLKKVSDDSVILDNGKWGIHLIGDQLTTAPTGTAYAYPSEESFSKYPLNATKAWNEWVEERKPKRWRAKKDEEEYWCIEGNLIPTVYTDYRSSYDNQCYDAYNYFHTEEEAKQVVESIKKVLVDFHNTRNEQ